MSEGTVLAEGAARLGAERVQNTQRNTSGEKRVQELGKVGCQESHGVRAVRGARSCRTHWGNWT